MKKTRHRNNPLIEGVNDIVDLFFPSYCAACKCTLYRGETHICTRCLIRLPKVNFHDDATNAVEKLFWGRCELKSATAFLRMSKHGGVHRMIHELKYRNHPLLGIHLGQLFAYDLRKSERMNHFDLIIPVPLHPRKAFIRGYNQSECIARGLSSKLRIPMCKDYLVRELFTESQTTKSRYHRWENVGSVFKAPTSAALENKHVLIIDDVITTGATIESCLAPLVRIPGIQISAAALALPV